MANKARHKQVSSKNRKSNSAVGLVKEYELLRRRCQELEIQNRSFALCLSAMVHNFGNYDPEGGSYEAGASEYVLRLKDFQAIGDTELLIETKGDVEGEAGTVIIVQFRKKPEESVTDGEAQEKSGS